MALFVVERYMGEEEEESVSTSDKRASDILQKIKESALQRKLEKSQSPKLRKSSVGDDSNENVDQHVKAGKKKRKSVSLGLDEIHVVKEHNENDVDQCVKTEKKKRKSVSLGVDEIHMVKKEHNENGVDQHVKTEKKKRKSVSLDDDAIHKVKKKLKKRVGNKNSDTRKEELLNEKKTHLEGTNKEKVDEEEDEDYEAEAEEDAEDSGCEEDVEEKMEGVQDEVAMETESTGDAADGLDPGFQVLGEHHHKRAAKVQRVLPSWLSHPTVIDNDLTSASCPVDSLACLDSEMKQRLKDSGITNFFPVQRQVIPALLSGWQHGEGVGSPSSVGYVPTDLCCSAPTGSGKTLAFVLPIVQALKQRVVCHVRALVLLPVRDLATQVYKVFNTYTEGTQLKTMLLVGQKPMHKEQQQIVRMGVRGPLSLVDIIVATPGRLVDHIKHTPGFSLKHLRYLVIDEADRMMDEIKQDWLVQLEACIQGHQDALLDITSSTGVFQSLQRPLTVASAHCVDTPPLQKLLFSATLSQNPEKLQQLHLVQPSLITAVVPSDNKDETMKSNGGEFVGKYTTPTGLTEYLVQVSLDQKPLVLLHFLYTLKFRHVLCFTNSVETAHRLFLLIQQIGGLEVREFSANLQMSRRSKVLKQFAAGKIHLLICSDALARGMDVEDVKCVISYDCPKFLKTYIHRIGRTARAGRVGTAVTLLEKKEIYHFKKMVREAGKPKVTELKVTRSDLRPLVEYYQSALQDLEQVLENEKPKKIAGR